MKNLARFVNFLGSHLISYFLNDDVHKFEMIREGVIRQYIEVDKS